MINYANMSRIQAIVITNGLSKAIAKERKKDIYVHPVLIMHIEKLDQGRLPPFLLQASLWKAWPSS